MVFRMISMLWIVKTITTDQLMNVSTLTDHSRICIKVSYSHQFTRDQSNFHKHGHGQWDLKEHQESIYLPWVPHFIPWKIQIYCLWLMGLTMNNWFNQLIENQEIWAQYLHKFRTTSARFHSYAIQRGEEEVDMPKVSVERIFFRWPDSSTWTRAWSEKIINIKEKEIQQSLLMIYISIEWSSS